MIRAEKTLHRRRPRLVLIAWLSLLPVIFGLSLPMTINENLIASTKITGYQNLGTQAGGILRENTTWTRENSPYTITDTVQVPSDVTLTIEPGVTITQSTMKYMFLLQGTIRARGTVDNRISFDGGTTGSGFFNVEGATSNTFLELDYCVIKNSGIFWLGSSGPGHFNLTHSELENLAWPSYVWYPEEDIHIEFNIFVNTGGFRIGHSGFVKVYFINNLFKGKYPNLPEYVDFCIQNWASYGDSETIVKYNSFVDMTGVVLELEPRSDSAAMSATENYWGTQDTGIIDSMIYDRNDDITCAGYIDYLPILSEPDPNTPEFVPTPNTDSLPWQEIFQRLIIALVIVAAAGTTIAILLLRKRKRPPTASETKVPVPPPPSFFSAHDSFACSRTLNSWLNNV